MAKYSPLPPRFVTLECVNGDLNSQKESERIYSFGRRPMSVPRREAKQISEHHTRSTRRRRSDLGFRVYIYTKERSYISMRQVLEKSKAVWKAP